MKLNSIKIKTRVRRVVMPQRFRRRKLSSLIHTALVSSLAVPALAQAQDEIEEVVVTGSYIRNSALRLLGLERLARCCDLFSSWFFRD